MIDDEEYLMKYEWRSNDDYDEERKDGDMNEAVKWVRNGGGQRER